MTTVTIDREEYEALKRDRDEWRKQHENLLAVRNADLAIFQHKTDQLLMLLRRSRKHIMEWWDSTGEGGSGLSPAKSPQLIEDINAAIDAAKDKVNE